jgi:hypothetical protein
MLASLYNTLSTEKLQKLSNLFLPGPPALVAQGLQKIFDDRLHFALFD